MIFSGQNGIYTSRHFFFLFLFAGFFRGSLHGLPSVAVRVRVIGFGVGCALFFQY